MAKFGESDDNDMKAGILYKRSRLGLFWNKRWVHVANGEMSCNVDPVSSHPKTVISLDHASVQVKTASRNRFRFEVTSAVGQKYEFAAETPREVNEWMRFLRLQLVPQDRRKSSGGTLSSPTQQQTVASDNQYPQITENMANTTNDNSEGLEIAWNEIYQSIIEQHENTFDSSVTKAHSLNQVSMDFVSCALRLSRTVIEEYTLPPHLKTIQPLDRHDSTPEDETFMQEGIVFQYMHEQNGSEAQDELRRKTCTHDMHGIQAYANTTVKALVPIYDDSHVSFGQVNGEFIIDSSADSMLEQAANELGLATHEVYITEAPGDAPEIETVNIHSSSAIMIHKGEDQRLYITNLTRSFPSDRGFGAKEDLPGVRQLRPEFVRQYGTKLSPDAFIITIPSDFNECDSDVEKSCRYLRETIIPDFVKQLDLLQVIPIDSPHITTLMHIRGINIRYLGMIAEMTLLPHVREMAVCEMVGRCCKQLLNQSMRSKSRVANSSRRNDHTSKTYDEKTTQKLLLGCRTHIQSLRDDTVAFFNTVFGSGPKSVDFWKHVIEDRVQKKFAYTLSTEHGIALHRPLLLASMQYHCGVRLVDSGSNLTFNQNAEPLEARDLKAVNPRYKWPQITNLKCQLFPQKADQYMESGSYDMAIQALRLKLDIISCNHSERTPLQTPKSMSSTLPPPPPPPHQSRGPRSEKSFPEQGQLLCIVPTMQNILNDLCEAYICKEDMFQARDCAKRSLELSLGPDARTSATYAHLVGIYRSMAETERADQCLKIAFSILRHLYGSHHPLILRLLDDVGTRYLELGLNELAEQSFRQAIDLALTSLGKSHPTTAQFYTRLANVYHLEGCLDKAKDCNEKACLIYEGIYGAASIEVARSCFYLSDILAKKGDHEVARYYNQRALKIRMQLLGENAPDTLDSIHQVAWQAHHREDHTEAIPYFEKLLAHFKNLPSPSEEALLDIQRMTKAVIRLSLRALPMDTIAFLDKVYQQSKKRSVGENGEIDSDHVSPVIRKLYQKSPSTYINELVNNTSKGVNEPGYTDAIADFLVILNLMENSDDNDEDGEKFDIREDEEDDGEPELQSLSYAIDKSWQSEKTTSSSKTKDDFETESRIPYILGIKPNTVVKS